MAHNPTTVEQERNERTEHILKRAQKMLEAKHKYSQYWEKYEKIWKRFEDERSVDDAWRANLPDTWLFATVKTAQSAFIDSKLRPVYKRHEKEDHMKHRDMEDLYTHIADKGNLDMELYYYRLDAFKLGTGFLKTVYMEQKRKVRDIKRFNPKTGEVKYKERERRDFDDPKTVRVSPWLMLVDEMARADFPETANDCIEIEVLNREAAKQKYGHLVDNWDEKIPQTSSLRYFHQLTMSQNKTAVESPGDTQNGVQVKEFRFFAPFEISDDNVEILHYWSVSPMDTYEIVIQGYGAKVELEKKPSPIPYIHKQLPYTPVQYSPHSGDEFWGAGIIEIGLPEAENIKKHREMMNDRQKISLFAPVFADVDDEIDQRQLKLKPLSVIRTRGGKPTQMQIAGANSADFEMEDRGAMSLKRAVGIDERILGMQAEGQRLTATEAGFIREAAMRRLREFSFILKQALLREVRLKNSLFKQYYSSPVKRERITTQDGMKKLVNRYKRFTSEVDNVYKEREINPKYFESEINVDIDMRTLLPVTASQLVSKWGQILRDSMPLVQGGAINVDLEKIWKRYVEALEANPESLMQEDSSESIQLAESEHKMLANHNTSSKFLELNPEGTPKQFLNGTHLRRHVELMNNDDKIERNELENVLQHIAKDKQNLEAKIREEQAQMKAQQMDQQAAAQIGGINPQGKTGGNLPNAANGNQGQRGGSFTVGSSSPSELAVNPSNQNQNQSGVV